MAKYTWQPYKVVTKRSFLESMRCLTPASDADVDDDVTVLSALGVGEHTRVSRAM